MCLVMLTATLWGDSQCLVMLTATLWGDSQCLVMLTATLWGDSECLVMLTVTLWGDSQCLVMLTATLWGDSDRVTRRPLFPGHVLFSRPKKCVRQGFQNCPGFCLVGYLCFSGSFTNYCLRPYKFWKGYLYAPRARSSINYPAPSPATKCPLFHKLKSGHPMYSGVTCIACSEVKDPSPLTQSHAGSRRATYKKPKHL